MCVSVYVHVNVTANFVIDWMENITEIKSSTCLYVSIYFKNGLTDCKGTFVIGKCMFSHN